MLKINIKLTNFRNENNTVRMKTCKQDAYYTMTLQTWTKIKYVRH